MRNPLKKLFGGEAEAKKTGPTVFATTLVPEPNSLSGSEHYAAMVARQRGDGLFEVGVEGYFEHKPTKNMVAFPHRPGSAGTVVVDANTAYDMLSAFESEHYSPGDGLTKTLENAGAPSRMKDLAAQARRAAAAKSGGRLMKMALSRRGGPNA